MMMRACLTVFVYVAILSAPVSVAQTVQHGSHSLVDLSHAYNEETLYWPTSPTRFEHNELAFGMTPGGWFYSAYSFSMPEHGGTHIDAPMHFAEGRWALDEIPLETLIGTAVVIDISQLIGEDADYRLSLADVLAFEAKHGQIPEDSILLLMTGWSGRWPDAKAYLGDDTPGDASNLHFPGFGVDATRFLVEKRRVKMLGIDTASIDYGQSADFPAHRIAYEANVPGLENLTNLHLLPVTGAMIVALPIKIEGGSGGPVRVVAIMP